MDTLTSSQIANALRMLDVAWSALPGEGLVRVWPAQHFEAAAGIAAKLVPLVNMYDSKPALLITNDMVQLVLSAPQGGLTAKEVALAEAIDKLLH